MAWNGDYYYLIGYVEKRQKATIFRVDRIDSNPIILDETSRGIPDDFDLIEFTNQVFQMFDGPEETVQLQCENEIMKNIIDRFGTEVQVVSQDNNTFTVSVKVSISATFFGWVLGFGGGIRIISPSASGFRTVQNE